MPNIIDRTGETSIATNGMQMTIITYRKSDDIDIQFKDGTIIKNKKYMAFKNGNIKHPNINVQIKNKSNETNIANNGMMMTIIAYRKNIDIDIQFEDGTIVEHKSYKSFKKGEITNPNYNPSEKYIGQTNTATNGMLMTIIAYRKNIDIDIQFEDGTIVKHKRYVNFKNGQISNPNYDPSKKYIGQTNTANNAMLMTIIAYRKYNDIDIQFKDGTIVKHKNYKAFENGEISNPNYNPSKKCIGENNIAVNSMSMTIIDYRNANDIDIQFEDGTIVKHKRYGNFKNGTIKNPNYDQKKYINETNIATNGMIMTIIKYHNYKNIDIQFEDNAIVKHKSYQAFKNSEIAYINQYKTIQIKKLAYHVNNKWAFYVKCQKCGLSDVMTYQQMQQHICNH